MPAILARTKHLQGGGLLDPLRALPITNSEKTGWYTNGPMTERSNKVVPEPAPMLGNR